MSTELFSKRVKNLVDATSFREPEKVPVGFEYLSWPYGYAGVTMDQVVSDPVKHAEAYCKFMERVKFDFTMNSGFYAPYDAFQALGAKGFTICEDGCTVQHDQAESYFMTEDDYDLLIKDPGHFMYEYYLRKNIPAFSKPEAEAYEMLKNAAECANRCVKTTEEIARITMERYGIVPLAKTGPLSYGNGPIDQYREKLDDETKKLYGMFTPSHYTSLDNLFDNYRGMMGVFEDLIENTEQLDAACQAMDEYDLARMPAKSQKVEGTPFPLGFSVYHVAPYLSPSQYEKYWFKAFKEKMLPYAEEGKKIFIKGEGNFLHTIERFKEFPKGSVIIQLENDDPFAAYEKIGGHQTLAVGMKTSLFAVNNVQKCKDYAKHMFDTFAPGGGFIFFQDRPFLSPSDAKIEAVEDVWNFVNEYSYGGKKHG